MKGEGDVGELEMYLFSFARLKIPLQYQMVITIKFKKRYIKIITGVNCNKQRACSKQHTYKRVSHITYPTE